MMIEIPESEATGAVARCYADIRAKQNVPIVNLIWRHLAAIGEIESCWQRVVADLPMITSQAATLNGFAHALAATLPAIEGPPHSSAASRILVSYERGNSLNLATVRHLLGYEALPPSGSLPDTPTDLPAIPRLEDLPPTLRAAVERLSQAGPATHTGIRPTLWVHLATLPEWLEAAARGVAQCLNSDSFRAAHQRLVTPPPARQDDLALSDAARSTLARFNSRIGEMLLIGPHLERASTTHPGIHS